MRDVQQETLFSILYRVGALDLDYSQFEVMLTDRKIKHFLHEIFRGLQLTITRTDVWTDMTT